MFNPSDTERVFNLDLVISMFVVCFRWPPGSQGEEQEAGGRDGSCLPGHPEHVNTNQSFPITTPEHCPQFPKDFVLK